MRQWISWNVGEAMRGNSDFLEMILQILHTVYSVSKNSPSKKISKKPRVRRAAMKSNPLSYPHMRDWSRVCYHSAPDSLPEFMQQENTDRRYNVGL